MSSHARRTSHGDDGQVLVMLVVSLVALLAVAALAIDFGFVLHAHSELQASTNAAATAGALALTNNTTGVSDTNSIALQTACSYGGSTSSSEPACAGASFPAKNAYGDLAGVQMASGYPQVKCLQTMVNLGLACINAGTANAIEVIQEVTVPTFFARVIGISSMTLRATAVAAMKGGTPTPANVVVVLDSTASMSSSDSSSDCSTATGIRNPTRLDCAKWGVRTLLLNMDPCSAGLSSCGTVTSGNVPNPVQQVGLLTFPGLASSADAQYEYTSCGGGFKSSFVNPYGGPPTTSPPYYTIVQPSSDYRTSDSNGLNGASSPLVQAVDWASGNGCSSSQYGIQSPGGEGTYYAGVISQAQADLSALTDPRSSMQNVIIILSDGDATAKWNKNGPPQSQFTASTPQSYGQNECHQAITAAQAAAATQNAAGLATWVYTIAFGSPTSSSCGTDSPSISACSAMGQMASDPAKFYSDDANGCVSASNPHITSLGQIFQNISYDLLTTRLLPPDSQ